MKMKLRNALLLTILATFVICAAYCDKQSKDNKQKKSHHSKSPSNNKKADVDDSKEKPHHGKRNKHPTGKTKQPVSQKPLVTPKLLVSQKLPGLPKPPGNPKPLDPQKPPGNPKPPPREFRKIKTWIRKDELYAVNNWAERNNINLNTALTTLDNFRNFHDRYCSSPGRSSSPTKSLIRCEQNYNDYSPDQLGFEDPERGTYFNYNLEPLEPYRNSGSPSKSHHSLFTILFAIIIFLNRMQIFLLER